MGLLERQNFIAHVLEICKKHEVCTNDQLPRRWPLATAFSMFDLRVAPIAAS